MSETRPSGGEKDGAAELLASARARLAAAASDLALPRALRLGERQRSLVASLFAELVRALEDELRALLLPRLADAPEPLRAAFASAGLALAQPALEEAGPAAVPGLLPILLERAEEHRLAPPEPRLLATLAGHADPAVAAEAMNLLVLIGTRRDPFQEPLVGRGDVPAEILHRLAWTVAAALRAYAVARHGADPAALDEALRRAVASILAAHDEGTGVPAAARRLVGRLDPDDTLAARLLTEGALPLLVAFLAARAGLDRAAVWEMLDEPSGRGAPILIRAAGLGREAAAALLLALARDEARIGAQIDLFDTTGAEAARRALAPWRADPAYRAAIAELAG
ncbi:MAG: DUF2336 domain-containing protein [Allosphingosinicella sp.]